MNDSDEQASKTIFGFWVYVMTDGVLFASLFAVYAVLHNNLYGGPSGQTLFNLRYILAETIILLTSSFTCGLASLAVQNNHKSKALFWFYVTFLLGLTFLILEITDFRHLTMMGDSWRRSGFLSSFFALVGTHGLHIAAGLIWMGVMIARVWSNGLTKANARRLQLLAIFWHFLDVIWIFIFTIVYLRGGLGL